MSKTPTQNNRETKIEPILKLIKTVGMKKAHDWLKRNDKGSRYFYIKSKPMGKIYFSSKETK